MFKKKVTQQYPFDVRPTAPRYHGRHVLNRHPDGLEKCVGCELCAWACPADAIYVEGGDNTEQERYSPGERYGAVYQINYLRCIFCGLCIEACPTRSLTMSNEYELADDDRQRLIYTKEQLMAPLLPGMEAPPHPMRLGDSEQDYYVDVPARADGRPRTRHRTAPSRQCRPRGRPGRAALNTDSDRFIGSDFDSTEGGPGDDHAGGGRDLHGEAVLFWILGPIALAGAFGTVLARNAIHAALFLVMTMGSLGVFYFIQEAPFLGVVQIIVYTGAIMILFLFVLMLVGRDSSDSIVETLRGQRWAASLFGIGFALLIAGGVYRAVRDTPMAGLATPNANGGNVTSVAELLFTKYLFAFELTSALLITAAVGAMVLAHVEREPGERRGQRSSSHGADPLRRVRSRCRVRACSPTHDSVATPALLPDGTSRRRACPGWSTEPLSPDELERHGAAGRRSRSGAASREGSDEPDLLPGAVRGAVHHRRGRACWSGATRSSSSCASS